MNEIEATVARDEIRQLAYRYAHATDMRDLDLLVSCFVPHVRVGRDAHGHDALRENFDAQLRNIGVSILFVGNHLIDFDDDTHANGVVYCKAEIQDDERWVEQAIQYRDAYEKVEGSWLFVQRRHLLWYGAERGENPLTLEPADWPKRHRGRGTLPHSEETWQKFWEQAK